MKIKIIFVVILVVVLGGVGYYFFYKNNYKSPIEKISLSSPSKLTQSGQGASRDGFPSLGVLTSLSNYTAYFSEGSSLIETEYVYSLTDYKLVSGSVTSVLYDGQVYSQIGSLSQYDTSSKANNTDVPLMYSYANQVNALFNAPILKVKKMGACSYANQPGIEWDLYFNQLASYAQTYLVCTQNPKGYLMAVQEGAHLGSPSATYSSQIYLLSVGGVSPQTKANL